MNAERRPPSRRDAVGLVLGGGLGLGLGGCGPASQGVTRPESSASPRPSWIDHPPTAADALFGVGDGPTRRAARSTALEALAMNLEVRVTSRLGRFTDERVTIDGVAGAVDETYREAFVGAVETESQRQLAGVVESGYWTAPEGRQWVLMQAPRAPIRNKAAEAVRGLLAQWSAVDDARIMVLSMFNDLGVTTSFGARLASHVAEALRTARPGLQVLVPGRPGDSPALETLLERRGATALVYGLVESVGDDLLVHIKALVAPDLDVELASAAMRVPRTGEIALLHSRVRQRVEGFIKPLLMGLGGSGPLLEVRVEPPGPRAGELVRIRLRSDRSGYVTLLDIGPDGGVGRILPIRPDAPVKLEADTWYAVPDDVPELAGRGIIARAPRAPGPERLKAILTPEPMPELAAAFALADDDPRARAPEVERMRRRLRRLLADTQGAAVGATTYSVRA